VEYVVRFVVGGLIVSVFAALGDTLRPKSFAGLFDAAPSVALATLTLTVAAQGPSYAAVESRSMIAGAIALAAYCQVVALWMMRRRPPSLAASAVAIPIWFAVAFGLVAACGGAGG
jgi:uncharacterized membrane protein (GlpM family)